MGAQKLTPQLKAQRILKGALAAQGLTMAKLAKRMGKKQAMTISEWFADIYNVKLCDVMRVCVILHLDIVELLKIKED